MHAEQLEHHCYQEATYRIGYSALSSSTLVPLDKLVIRPARTFRQHREFRRDNDDPGRFPGDESGAFELAGQFRLGTSATDSCPINQILLNALGIAAATAVSGGIEYTPATGYTGRGMTLLQQGTNANTSTTRVDAFLGAAKGCVMSRLSLSVGEGRPLRFDGEGRFAQYMHMGGGLTADVVNGSDVITLGDGIDGMRSFGGGFQFSIAGDDNSGAGYRGVTDESAGTLTLTSSWTGSTLSARPLLPLMVDASAPPWDGNPHPNPLANTLSIASLTETRAVRTLPFISTEITLNTGLQPMAPEGPSNYPDAVRHGARSVSGRVVVYLQNESQFHIPPAFSGRYNALTFTFGDVGGRRVELSVPNARWEVVNEIPFESESEGTEITLEFTAEHEYTAGYMYRLTTR